MNAPWSDEDARPVNPATLQELGRVAASTPAELDRAAREAKLALDGAWSTDGRGRAAVLAGWADRLRAATDELVGALVAETGKPVTEARIEVAGSIDALSYNAGLARHIGGRAGTLPDGTSAHLIREPVGVTTFIVPWNWPVLLLLRDLAPALAAGVTALVKPAPQTTLVTRRVLELGRQAGLPDDAVHLLVGGGGVGNAAVAHPAVRAVAFTGSTAVGERIARAAAVGFKRTLLELGGKAASVVFADADLDEAVAASLSAAVVTSGQMCMACTRVLVERPVYAQVLDKLVCGAAGLVVGDPAASDTRLGPMVSAAQAERVEHYLDIARREATVLTGGEWVHPAGLPGHFVTPAVVTGAALDRPLVQDDIFGPVLLVEPFDTEADAVAGANATSYGLVSAVWTSSLDRAWRVGRALHAGTVWVNGFNRSYPEMPSGGYGSSGWGRTRGIEGVEQFTEIKHLHFSVGAAQPEGTK